MEKPSTTPGTFPGGGCTPKEAQGEEGCRLEAPPRIGVIVERGGTLIHLEETSISGPSANPLADIDALKRIVGSLVVLEP